MAAGFQIVGVLFITGGGSGIGESIARAFAEEGARGIALCDINKESLERVAALLKTTASHPEFQVETILVDVSNETQCEKAVQQAALRFGRIDYAVNCAFADAAICKAIIDVNLSGVFYCMRAQIQQMLRQDLVKPLVEVDTWGERGCIVNIGSICGMVGQAELGPYVATKHAVIGLTKTAAVENGVNGIRINSVSPGYIKTPFIKTKTQMDALMKISQEKVPVGRPGYASEIAAAVLFQCSPRASFITGANLAVDGGLTAKA